MEKLRKSFNLSTLSWRIFSKRQWFQFIEDNHHPSATLERIFADDKWMLNWVAYHHTLYGYPWDKNGKAVESI